MPIRTDTVVILDMDGLRKDFSMRRRRYTPEQIIEKLQEVESMLSQGDTIWEASRKLGITTQTYYNWRKAYGGMRAEQARHLKKLEKENTRLKRLVAELYETIRQE